MLRNLNQNQKFGLGAICAAIVFALAFAIWPRGSRDTLVIVNGQEYKILSYARVDMRLSEEALLDAYALTITYEDPERGMTRGVITVPRMGMKTDLLLAENTVVWDPPVTLEGKTYALARWNPGYSVPYREKPVLIPEDPLIRKTD